MNIDGSGLTRLTDGSGNPGIAALSPDGQQVAFDDAVGAGSPADLYLVNTDGSARRRLTDDPGDEDWPVWSPDGTRLAFARSDPTAAS
jgi:Tol biopolymer transport system component